MKHYYTLIFILNLLAISPLIAQNSVSSMSLGGGNGQAGVTFNVGSNQAVDIDSVGVALYPSGSHTVELWYSTSPVNGTPNISTANGWVLHTTAVIPNVTSTGSSSGIEYVFPLSTALQIPAGQTYGFYITTSGSVAYTSWTSSNQDVFTDGTVTLSTGQNIGYGGAAPSPTFHPRQFNGSVYYSNSVFTPWDAGVTHLEPAAVCSGNNTIFAGIQNYGDSVINQLTVNWTLNGVLQTPVYYFGTLDTAGGSGLTTDTIALGVVNFVNNVNTNITAWTSHLNAIHNDTINYNDTVSVTMQPSLNGTYTIGGIGGDFSNFTAAVNALNAYGVCGPVTFEVATGIYNEQIWLSNIAGSSANNTIKFKSAAGDSSLVTLTYGSTGSADNYVVYFDGADHITFEGMTIENTGTSYSTVLYYANGSDYNVVQHCRILSTTGTSTSTNQTVIYSASGNNDNHNWFLQNEISGGSHTFYWYGGGTTNRGVGLRIEDNEITSGYYRGIYSYYNDSVQIINNTLMITANSYSIHYWIYMYYNKNGFQITHNKIGGWGQTSTGYGLYLSNSGGTTQNRALIANNFFVFGDASSSNTYYGIYNVSSGLIDMVHNNINVTTTSTGARALYLSSGGNFSLYNNNIQVNGPGYGIYASNPFVLQDSDYNNIYAPAGYTGYAAGVTPTLSDWQQATDLDMHSHDVNPNYTSFSDLHVCNDTLDGAGMLVGITDDFDGDLRNPQMIDIGADQFISGAPELGPDTFFCVGNSITLGSPQVTGVSYSWNNTATTAQTTVNIAGTYMLTTTTACGTGTDTIVVDQRDVPFVDFTANPVYMTGIFTNTTTGGGTSFLWDFGNGATSTDENPVYIYPNTGTYQVTLTVTNECGTSSITKTVVIAVPGVSEHGGAGILTVSPNPSNGIINFGLETTRPGNYNVQVTSLDGRMVYTKQIRVSGNTWTEQTDLSELPAGMYLLGVSGPEGSTVARFIIE